jgi:RecB family exonuclease
VASRCRMVKRKIPSPPAPCSLRCVAEPVELHLARHADTAWTEVIRPWLERGRGQLERALVVVPTRGQAQALKQRCLEEGIALLGVEFLTPSLARKQWLNLALPAGSPGADLLGRPPLGREFLRLGLRALVARRLAAPAPAGIWRSLASDPDGALDAFGELLRAGGGPDQFPRPELREVFVELAAWADRHGFALPELQCLAAAQAPATGSIPGRILVAGLGAESWPEFWNLAALLRHGGAACVVLPEPEFSGRGAADEKWVEAWEAFFGVDAMPLDAPEPAGCGAVAELWTGGGGSAENAGIIVGRTRADEMGMVADRVAALLGAGARNVAVVFPRADAAHQRLAGLLAERGVPFADLLESPGAPPIDAQLQRGLLAFHARGGRLEELLALWPLLRALGIVSEPPGAVRKLAERLYDDFLTHALAAYPARLAADNGPVARELRRVAEILLPAWPAEPTLADAVVHFERMCASCHVALPEGWNKLAAFAITAREPLPLAAVVEFLQAVVPAGAPDPAARGRGKFAPVTLTTLRRAAGVAWSHVILAESNAGVWPRRAEPGVWLSDETRAALAGRGGAAAGLLTSAEQSALERDLCARLARDTRGGLIFSAALFDEADPELLLAPNAWLERVLVRSGGLVDEHGLEKGFALLAPARAKPAPGVPPGAALAAWAGVWRRRRDPEAPFDEHFFAGPPAQVRPAMLSARRIERGLVDPAELWFEDVLQVRRVEWRPLERHRQRALGQLAHRVLAAALAGDPAGGIFMRRPDEAVARARLAGELAGLRGGWPGDRYWDSFAAELAERAGALLGRFYELKGGPFLALEAVLPRGATIPVGAERLGLRGRMDAVLLDRPEWGGAQVEVIDFKTGADLPLTAKRLARGHSLQLGLYLAAVESLGAAGGRVWMLKAETAPAGVTSAELPEALAPSLERLRRHLASGRFGALTADRDEFTHTFNWPLACAPVPAAVLAKKFALTFGDAGPPENEEAGDA